MEKIKRNKKVRKQEVPLFKKLSNMILLPSPGSSVGQSVGLMSQRSWVRFPPRAFLLQKSIKQIIDNHQSSCHHHSHELLVVNVAITVNIGFPDHLVNLFLGQFFAQVSHYVTKFGCRNQSITVSVKYFECFNQLLFSVCVLHFSISHANYLAMSDKN